MNEVTIIIPNYNGSDDLRTCLLALEKQTHPAEVIVVDDGSSDHSTEVAEAFVRKAGPTEEARPAVSAEAEEDPAVRGIAHLAVLRHETNRGFAAAVNTGIRAAKTPYVILLNNDTEPEPGFTEALVRAIQKRKKAFAVQGLLLQGGMSHPPQAEDNAQTEALRKPGNDADVIDSSGDYFCALGWAFSPGRDKPASAYNRPTRIMSACAGAAIYDRALLEELGLFDEAHFCYLEDVDLSLRAYRAGWRIYFEPSARVLHKASASSGSRYNAFKTRLTTANSLYTAYKNMPAWLIVLYAPLLLAGFAIKGVFYARQGFGKDFVTGLREGAAKIAAYRETGGFLPLQDSAGAEKASPLSLRRDAMLAMELLGNCVRRIRG